MPTDVTELRRRALALQYRGDPDAADMTAGAFNMVGLPATNLGWKYPTEAMCKSFFVDAVTSAYTIRQDGYVGLSIKGMQTDFTGRTAAP